LLERVMADPTAMQPVAAETGGLGYRGFIVTALSESAETEASAINKARLRTASGEMVKFPSQFRLGGTLDRNASTANWLLETSEKQHSEVTEYLRAYTQQAIFSAAQSVPEKNPQAAPGPAQATPEGAFVGCGRYCLTSNTDFSFWNNATAITQNNCYNFASNYRSNTFAQPGRLATGQGPLWPTQGWDVIRRVRADGWSDNCVSGTPGNIVIALVVSPMQDFHFYRMCANGYWCHKAGKTPARNWDDSGRLIINPETCNRGIYTEFWGYFYANYSKQVL
jgi:hypothetical protein